LATWVVLLILLAGRLAATFSPSMYAWGLNAQRFTHPAVSALLLGLLCASIIPVVAKAAWTALCKVLPTLAAARATTALAFGLLAAVTVWCLPDRVWFTGDFAVRLDTIERGEGYFRVFPESLPLDTLIHFWIPIMLSTGGPTQAGSVVRLLGGLEAFLLAVLAFRFTELAGRALPRSYVLATVLVFGGHLALFTGHPKADAEMCLLVVWMAMATVRMMQDGKGVAHLAGATCALLLLHRAAIVFLPAIGLAWVKWHRLYGRHGGWRRPSVVLSLVVSLLAAGGIAPRVVEILRDFDMPRHLSSPGILRHGGLLAASIHWLHLLDVTNSVVLLSPITILLPVLLVAGWRRVLSEPAGQVLGCLAASAGLAIVLAHPQQGLFRDWDVVGPMGMALTVVCVWLMLDLSAAMPLGSWVVVSLIAASTIPSIGLLIANNDLGRGLARARAFLIEPPRREPVEVGYLWDFLAGRAMRTGQWTVASEAAAHFAEAAPTRRSLLQWALAETYKGDLVAAERVYRRLLGGDADDPYANLGLAAVASRLGAPTVADSALGRVRSRLDRRPEFRPVLAEYVARFPVAFPESVLLRVQAMPP
jgi:hypothetical protein